jgi:hypothetical protein
MNIETTTKLEMAFETINRPQRQIIDRPTTEEHEKSKEEFALHFAKELINGFTAEDRWDVFQKTREYLEEELKTQATLLHEKIKGDMAYLKLLQNLIY